MHDAYYKIILLLVGICICHAYYMLEYAFSIIYSKKKLCVKKEYKFLSEKELIHWEKQWEEGGKSSAK